jgi:ribonuclease D
VQYRNVIDERSLADMCRVLSQSPVITFDTEFVSEDSYRPELCLIQVSAGDELFVVDPLTIEDLSPFWEQLAAPDHITVVHAGREELRFSYRAIGRFPHNVFDVQLAAGFVGLEYPAAYATLVGRLLDRSLSKGETRTDWRRRPLSRTQIEYALQDVLYLEQLHRLLESQLQKLNRSAWFDEELSIWQKQLQAIETSENWRRVSGLAGLSTRSLAVVRELWRWREEQAERRNMPARRVLRDDLLVELARRQTADLRRIRAVRGLDRRNLQHYLPEISDRIERALGLPEESYPARPIRSTRPQLSLLGQFLATTLGSICRDAQIATGIVGSAEDVRDLVSYRLGLEGADQEPPALAVGWRAEVVGRRIDEVLQGRLAVRVTDPLAEQPLEFVRDESGKDH